MFPKTVAKIHRIYTSLKKALEAGAQKVDVLYLNHNDLKHFPADILELNSLKELWLGQNTISKIPRQINRLSQLRILDLSHNKIRKLPEEIKELKKLKSLDLRHNTLNEDERIRTKLLLPETEIKF